MAMKEIGIFRALDSNTGWFELDVSTVLQRVIDAASDVLGNDPPENRVYLIDNPQPATKAKRVGRVVVESVEDDDEVYEVTPADHVLNEIDDGAAGILGTETEINRRPKGDPGRWVIQALIFGKDEYTLDQAREWIANNENYGDYGFEETDKAWHFRQYDRKWFDMFRIITVATGVSEVYAQISEEEDRDLAEKCFVSQLEKYDSVHEMNQMIASRGLSLIVPDNPVEKTDEGEDEERFILGLVLEPTMGAGVPFKPDTQDDVYTDKTIRQAAHGWMENYGAVDLMHNWKELGRDNVRILESYIAPIGFKIGEGEEAYKILKGTWLLALRVVNDELWAAVQSGDLGAYSIGGVAERTELEDRG